LISAVARWLLGLVALAAVTWAGFALIAIEIVQTLGGP